jgi:AcrR family transcriptional regulator
MSSTHPDTKERILEAAFKLFAENGFSGTSLRSITAEAGVNLASVNYHFGSKDELIRALFRHLIGPVNEERLARLDRIEAVAGDGPLPLQEVVEAFVVPPLHTWHEQGHIAVRLLGRIYTETSESLLKLFHETFDEIVRRFLAAMLRAVPALPPEEALWKLYFSVGAMAHVMVTHDLIQAVRPEMDLPTGPEEIVRRLVPFVCGGIEASPTLPETGSEEKR